MGIINLLCNGGELRRKVESSRLKLYRIAYAWCGDPYLADDLTQETLSKALKGIARLRNPETFNSWLFTIHSNTWRSYLRAKRDLVEFNEEHHESDNTPEVLNQRLETVQAVQSAIARLSVGQRQVVTLVDLEEFSYADVATILAIPIGTVMSRLCRARRALKEMLINTDEVDSNQKVVKIR